MSWKKCVTFFALCFLVPTSSHPIFPPSPSLRALFVTANSPLQISLLHCQVEFHSFISSTPYVTAHLIHQQSTPIGSQILIYFSPLKIPISSSSSNFGSTFSFYFLAQIYTSPVQGHYEVV